VTRPSKVGEGFLIVFGLFFAAFGLFAASTFFSNSSGPTRSNGWVGLLFGAIFTLVGGGIIYGAIYGNRKLQEQAAVEQANPDSPWLWRKDWAASQAESKNRNSAIGLWLVAIFADAIVFTIAASTLPKLWRASDPKAFVPLLFCVAGLILTGAAIRASIRRKRFGQTYFQFASLPFSPGRPLKGTIHLRFNTNARHGVDLRLSCVRQVTTGSGKDRSTSQTVLWQADKNVPQESLMPGPMGDATIPVDFSIPSDAYESNHDQPSDQLLWLLHAQADVPGVNYSDDFEVPVFRRTPSPGLAAESAAVFRNHTQGVQTGSVNDAQGETVPPAFQFDATDVAAPENLKVIVSPGTNGGTEFYFPPFRNPARTLVLILFTAIWTGLVYFLGHSKAPWFFAAAFGFLDFFLTYALIQSMMGSFRIEVGNGKIVFRRALLGIGAAREIPFTDIAQILAATTSAGQGTQPSYSVRLQTKDGKKVTLADAIYNRQEARWVVAQLEKFVGLKLDTHVAADPGFGAYGPPPQRGVVPSGSPARFRRNSPAAIAVGIVFMVAWTGYLGFRIFSMGHGTTNRVSKPGSPAKTALRQVVYSQLTDADLQHLQTLPEQEQAEELLDRAIRHDPRALDLFEQNIDSWHNLSRTARMNELEERSRFSTDLRVRYANTDLNLAIDGLPKTNESVDQLIAQAQADPEHRPYSVYHMGMLAGRGAGYDRIYPVLVDYAKNDANPEVRQWAVEGLRYLGTDEALDQLFDSFTHDPSNAVRDRAGCNVSDCGNFKRSQRMRMVPSLVELVADPQTTPQMRNWAFLALQGITDQSLPPEASAWQDWYTQHGSEKMAEFERLDWWSVRGDQ
jgi:hypothetical protein